MWAGGDSWSATGRHTAAGLSWRRRHHTRDCGARADVWQVPQVGVGGGRAGLSWWLALRKDRRAGCGGGTDSLALPWAWAGEGTSPQASESQAVPSAGGRPSRLRFTRPCFPAQIASRTGRTTPSGGSRRGSGCCRPTGHWTSTASWPTPASSSGPSTGPSSCGCPIAELCASEPASPSPSSRLWPPSAASSVSVPAPPPALSPCKGPAGGLVPSLYRPSYCHVVLATLVPILPAGLACPKVPMWGGGRRPRGVGGGPR